MPGRGRPRRFDRDMALRTAMMLFWEHGYEGTSMSMLTSAMGITPTSLYAAFGGKDQLFREAVELYNSVDNSPTDAALEETTTRGAIEAMLRMNAEAYIDPETPQGCMVVLAGLNLATGNEHVGRYLAECRRRDYTKVLERVERGITEGELPQELAPSVVASYSLTVLHGLSIQARDGCTRDQAHAIIDGAMMGWDELVRRVGETTQNSADGNAASS